MDTFLNKILGECTSCRAYSGVQKYHNIFPLFFIAITVIAISSCHFSPIFLMRNKFFFTVIMFIYLFIYVFLGKYQLIFVVYRIVTSMNSPIKNS